MKTEVLIRINKTLEETDETNVEFIELLNEVKSIIERYEDSWPERWYIPVPSIVSNIIMDLGYSQIDLFSKYKVSLDSSSKNKIILEVDMGGDIAIEASISMTEYVITVYNDIEILERNRVYSYYGVTDAIVDYINKWKNLAYNSSK